MATANQQVLFICSGNYYRSRFAELWFNHLAAERQVTAQAISRGFRLHANNVGPISQHTVERLATLQVACPKAWRHPLVLQELDLVDSQVRIAVKESEHRSMMRQYFPKWEDRIVYWHIDDVDCAQPEAALSRLQELVSTQFALLLR